MDMSDRHVLRRKKQVLSDILTFGIEDQTRYRERGLLDEMMTTEIMTETTQSAQVSKFLELLSLRKKARMSDVIQLVEEKEEYWLADEIHTELLLERQELQVEEYVFREAGVIVHKQWGKSRRFSELDKKELQFLLATRYQSAKEAWNRQLAKVKQQLYVALKDQDNEKNRMKVLADKVEMFVKLQQKRMGEETEDAEQTNADTQQFLKSQDKELSIAQYCDALEEHAEYIMEATTQLANEKDELTAERFRCMNVLELEDCREKLDKALEVALHLSKQEVSKSKDEAASSIQHADELDGDMALLMVECDNKVANMEQKVLQLQGINRRKSERIDELEKGIGEARRNYEELETELLLWKKRCGVLEKTRRMGYYNPAWEKLEKLEKKFNISQNSGCKCVKYDCGCCVDMKVSFLHIDTNACVNMSYLPDQYGFSLTLSIGGKVYIKEVISAKNPPPICVGLPDLHKYASACIVFYDLDYTSSSLSGCIKLELQLYHIHAVSVKVGCFNFPLVQESGTKRMGADEKWGSADSAGQRRDLMDGGW